MDEVKRLIAEGTIHIGPNDGVKWRERYEALYPDFPREVQVLKDERYGSQKRHCLDVYVPASTEADKPVILFVHGGGFFSGDKRWSDKCYANIGYYFAKAGMVTVVANYQLVPDVHYPGGADDIQLIREWTYQNISAPRYGSGSVNKVFLFGHSSGGAHIAMNLYAAGDPQRSPRDPLYPPVAGVLYLDVPFWYDRTKPIRQNTIRHYYGSDTMEIWAPKSGLGLLERLPADSAVFDSRLLPHYMAVTEWEIPETADANVMFLNAYRARSKPIGTLPEFVVLKGHNHWSDILSIGSDDTVVSESLLKFIEGCLKSNSPKQA